MVYRTNCQKEKNNCPNVKFELKASCLRGERFSIFVLFVCLLILGDCSKSTVATLTELSYSYIILFFLMSSLWGSALLKSIGVMRGLPQLEETVLLSMLMFGQVC